MDKSQVEEFLLSHNSQRQNHQAAEGDVAGSRSVFLTQFIKQPHITETFETFTRLEATRMKKVVQCAKCVLTPFESKLCKSVIKGLSGKEKNTETLTCFCMFHLSFFGAR